MWGYILKRILQVIPVLIVISFVCFIMIRLVPGDPVANMMGLGATKEAIEAQREALGLNQPIMTQYVNFVKGVFSGDFGTSIVLRKPVLGEILKRYPATIKLAIGGTIFATVVGCIFGMISAVKQNKFADNVIMVCSLLAVSTPSFFLALIMLLVFAVQLKWLPSMGLRTPLHYILPIVTLGMQSVGLVARTTRSSMLEVLGQDYIRTSKSMGVSQIKLVTNHAFKNALIPVITVVGLRFGGLLAGSMLVETVFSIQGIGSLMVSGVLNRDYPVVQGTVLVLATTFVLVNLLVDILYAVADPRIKYA